MRGKQSTHRYKNERTIACRLEGLRLIAIDNRCSHKSKILAELVDKRLQCLRRVDNVQVVVPRVGHRLPGKPVGTTDPLHTPVGRPEMPGVGQDAASLLLPWDQLSQ